MLNRDAGPDFSHTKIKIGDTLWEGSVEIHLKSSDWLKHNHQFDRSYENVILHVVYEHDTEIKRIDGTVLPVLELKNRIAASLIHKYENLFLTLTDFPCVAQIGHVDRLIIDSFLSRTLVARFEEKTQAVNETLGELKGDWDETFYRFMARNFGFKVNALPFELLAKAVPQHIYAKHKDNPLQIEALVFGAAGFFERSVYRNLSAEIKGRIWVSAKEIQYQTARGIHLEVYADAATEFSNHQAGTICSLNYKIQPPFF